MKSWTEFYQKRVRNKAYEQYVSNRYQPFLNLLKQEKGTIVEAGCGTGIITKLIFSQENLHEMYDQSIGMLKISKEMLPQVKQQKFDIRNGYNKLVDCIFSHGVLEHFNPEEIKKIVHNQLKVAKKVFHYVPTSKYNYKSFGDELLMSTKEWKELVKPTRTLEFNNGYDLVMEWSQNGTT